MFEPDNSLLTVVLSTGRVFLVGLFTASAAKKLFNIATFAKTIRSYELLPAPLVTLSAVSITVTEVLVVAFLALGVCIQFAAMCAAILLVLFSIAMAANLLRGRNWLDCGCVGYAGTRINWFLVVRNLAVVVTMCVPLLRGSWTALWAEPLKLDLSLFCGFVVLVLFALATLLFDISSIGVTLA